jgi:hypothetical protein
MARLVEDRHGCKGTAKRNPIVMDQAFFMGKIGCSQLFDPSLAVVSTPSPVTISYLTLYDSKGIGNKGS